MSFNVAAAFAQQGKERKEREKQKEREREAEAKGKKKQSSPSDDEVPGKKSSEGKSVTRVAEMQAKFDSMSYKSFSTGATFDDSVAWWRKKLERDASVDDIIFLYVNYKLTDMDGKVRGNADESAALKASRERLESVGKKVKELLSGSPPNVLRSWSVVGAALAPAFASLTLKTIQIDDAAFDGEVEDARRYKGMLRSKAFGIGVEADMEYMDGTIAGYFLQLSFYAAEGKTLIRISDVNFGNLYTGSERVKQQALFKTHHMLSLGATADDYHEKIFANFNRNFTYTTGGARKELFQASDDDVKDFREGLEYDAKWKIDKRVSRWKSDD